MEDTKAKMEQLELEREVESLATGLDSLKLLDEKTRSEKIVQELEAKLRRAHVWVSYDSLMN